MKRGYALILILFMSAIPLKPVKAQETIHSFPSINIYESDLDLVKGELGLYAWNREASIKFRVPINPSISDKIDERIELTYGTFKVNVYELKQSAKHEYGGIEYEVVLASKPLATSFAFKIDSQNLDFYYQPPLYEELNPLEYDFMNATHAMIKGEVVVYRPIDIVGSYAVYHSSKRDNEYKTGKFLHIHRPKLIDNDGKEAWANMNIENDVLRIDLPKSFLESAKYPVIIDPSFGYETAGGSYQGAIYQDIYGSMFSCSETGTADSITWYGRGTNIGTKDVKPLIYLHSDSGLEGEAAKIAIGSTLDWYTHNFSDPKPSLVATDYILCCWFAYGQARFHYDAGDTDQGHYAEDQGVPNGAPDPISFSHNDNKYSIYCNYTAGAAGVDYIRDISQSIDWDGNASKGQWDLTRTFSQSISLSSSLDREWSLRRALSQTLTFTWDASGILSALQDFVRTISLSVNWASSMSRRVDFHRSFSQTLTFTWNAYGPIFEVFRRTISLAINFTYDLPGLAVRTIRIWVRNLQNIAIESALVTLSNPSAGTILWAYYTDPQGYTIQEVLSPGEYSLWVTKEEYQTYNLLFNFTETTIVQVPLSTLGEGITIPSWNILTLIFLIFVGLLIMSKRR